MSIDAGNAVATRDGVVLTDSEKTELEIVASHLSGIEPLLVDDPAWLRAAQDLSSHLPVRLRQTLRRFAADPGADAMLLLRNLPVNESALPDTPSRLGSVQRESTLSASALVLIACQLGEPIAFREEKSGALVQDVVPVPGHEEYQGNAGSTRLTMHVENAFHPHRPDFVGLNCLRSDHENIAGLKIASIRNALPLLDAATRAVLFEPRFATAAPASFGAVDEVPLPHGILSGAVEDPDIKVDFTSTQALDGQAEAAMNRLGEALEAVCRTLLLRPGDLAFADNRLALHGRDAFTPRYDGRDRWLQRVFVHLDLRRSRALRAGGGHVLSSTS